MATFEYFFERCSSYSGVMSICSELTTRFHHLQKTYLPWISEIPVYQGISWVPTWKSLPNSPKCRRGLKEKGSTERKDKRVVSSFPALKYELAAFARHTRVELESMGLIPTGLLWESRVHFALYRESPSMLNSDISRYIENVHPVMDDAASRFGEVFCSGVAATPAGAGKLRLFIIGNYVKQRLLKPYHDWAMSVLRRLDCDGTYNQTKPLERLVRFQNVYSFDMKSATDRWPRVLIYQMIALLFDVYTASSVVNSSLGLSHVLTGPPLVKRYHRLPFSVVGQPLGYYASWPLFSLSHHMVVWLAAERVYPGSGKFKAYATLGDDVVIADSRVAKEYQEEILSKLEVKISTSKSLISNSGAFEFAKRFRIREGRVDITPISLLQCRTTLGLASIRNTYNVISLNTMLRLGGAGYRVLARSTNQRL
ncbi:hypothetical protein ACOSQ2_003204 [Xanthoceras sorbifolium]